MKKRGFTLAELLIVLGITGVVAALILPAINGLMPDKTKVMYLRVYDELSKNIKQLASDSSIYPVCLESGSESIGCSDHPLLNTTKPINKRFDDSDYEGNKKLCKLLAFTMNSDNDNCSDDSYTFSSSSFTSDFNANKSFTTANGMEWWIVPQTNTASGGTASYQTDIYVDVDGKNTNNCIYDSTSCKKPDRFKFMIAADGTLVPADPMGLMYINTRKSFLKNKNQKVGDDVAIATDLNGDLKTFNYEPCVERHEPAGPTPEEECIASGGIWDAATNTCGTPGPTEEEKCIASGGIWDAASGVCREPEQEEPQEPEFDPNSVRVTFTLVPLKGTMVRDINTWQQPESPARFGLFGRVQINRAIEYNIRSGISISSGSSTYSYICTIPAGKTACVTKVINRNKIYANVYGRWSIGSAFASINDSRYKGSSTVISNITTYNKDAYTSESRFDSAGGYSFSTRESYKDSTNSGYIPPSEAERLDYYRIGVLSGGCKSPINYSNEFMCKSLSNNGKEWFFNDVDPSLLSGKSSFPDGGGKYEIIEANKVQHQEYYQ